MKQSILRKSKWLPRPHDDTISCILSPAADVVTKETTIIPIITYDEGKGAPSAYNAHREHASFVEAQESHCYVGSEIHNVIVELQVALSSFFNDDNLLAMKFAYMPIYTSFEDLTVIDELSSTEIQDVLGMQSESTDNQAYPLYNGTDIDPTVAGADSMPANQLGLTTDDNIEYTTFNVNTYYDALHYLTISEKLKACQGGLHWRTLTKSKPTMNIRFPLPSKIKMLQKKSFFGILLHVPSAANIDQIHYVGEMVAASHLVFKMKYRYNEWNEEFNFSKL